MLFTPPLTPQTPAENHGSTVTSRPIRYQLQSPRYRSFADADVSPEFVLPPPLEPVPLELPEPSLSYETAETESREELPARKLVDQEWTWSRNLSPLDKESREEWLSGGRGRRGLRIVIVTGTSAPSRQRILLHRRELSSLHQRRLEDTR
jgi:hypothetical protein